MDTPKIYAAMINILRDVKAIGKDKQTSGFASFNYRGIDDVYNALNPVMAKHGVFCVPELIDSNREERTNTKDKVVAYVTVKVRYTFYAEDGSSVSCVVAGEGMDSGDKATPKALSIAMKYALFQTFCIPTEELADPDAEVDQLAPRGTVSKQQHEADRAQAKASNINPPTLEQLAAFWATMKERHPDAKSKEEFGNMAYADIGKFVGRKIKSASALTKNEISEFLNACKGATDKPF